MKFWTQVGGAETWRALLNQHEDEDQTRALRHATYSGQAFGNEAFLDSIGAQKKVPSAAGMFVTHQEAGIGGSTRRPNIREKSRNSGSFMRTMSC